MTYTMGLTLAAPVDKNDASCVVSTFVASPVWTCSSTQMGVLWGHFTGVGRNPSTAFILR